MHAEDFDKVTTFCERTAELVFEKCKGRQVKKFEKLRAAMKTDGQINLRPSWLVNLSK